MTKARMPEYQSVITAFQALNLIAEKYQSNPLYQGSSKQIKELYLSGIEKQEDKQVLDNLLKDDVLDRYKLTTLPVNITNDPVRRYFESHLCRHTLQYSLDGLELSTLQDHYNKILELGEGTKNSTVDREYDSILKHISDSSSDKADVMFSFATRRTTESIEEFKKRYEANKQKLSLIIKSAKKSMELIVGNDHNYPISIYRTESSPYSDAHRGIIPKIDQEQVRSNNLGIMKSFMPLPLNDSIRSDQTSDYLRFPDKSHYDYSKSQPNKNFSSLVKPFVNSISGTTLCQLRVMSKLLESDNFVFAEKPELLNLYTKSFISAMLVHSGGHCLDEFMRVFQIKDVKDAFISAPKLNGFEDFTAKKTFLEHNSEAFENSLKDTIKYNQTILLRKKIMEEILLDNGSTPIELIKQDNDLVLYYTRENNLEKIQDLIDKGEITEFNVRDEQGYSTLDIAALSGNHQLISLFIENGINVSQHKALQYAVGNEDFTSALILIAAGAKIDQDIADSLGIDHSKADYKKLCIEKIITEAPNINLKSPTGITPLDYALKYNKEVAFSLIENRKRNGVKIEEDQAVSLQKSILEDLTATKIQKVARGMIAKNKLEELRSNRSRS